MPPDSLDADPTELPRTFRGYHRAATEELFRRVAWEYGVLAGEHRKLRRELEEQQPVTRVLGEVDEDARALFAAARKAVREMRESARAECEKALKKARRRATEIEVAADRAAVDAVAVIDAAAELRANLRDALRRLESGQSSLPAASATSLRDEMNDPVPAPGGFDLLSLFPGHPDPEGAPPEGPPNAA